jgi:hypothetical protein
MKTETEIRAAFNQLDYLLRLSKKGMIHQAPVEIMIVHAMLEWLCSPSLKPETEIRARRSFLLEENSGGMIAAVLAWALNETTWPNYQVVCAFVALTDRVQGFIRSQETARRN